MKDLTIVAHKGQFAIESREVAGMVSKQHKDLLESIRKYEQFLLSGDFRSVDFFIPSKYQDSTGRTLLCYFLTRKGCDLIANKMTGKRGVLFSATYINKFNEMERASYGKPKLTADQALEIARMIRTTDRSRLPIIKDIFSYAGINIEVPVLNSINFHIQNYFENTSLHGTVRAAEVYRDYLSWCGQEGHIPVSQTLFGHRMAACGIGKYRTRSARFYMLQE
jgi:Rha family phage regulatory protein